MSTRAPAVCSAEFWSYNTLNQSPCVVGSALVAVCQPGAPPFPALPPNMVYVGPRDRDAETTPCRCSSVVYSLISACAHCQVREYIRWTPYQVNCTTVYAGVFPRPIPRGVAVPAWAYMDVTTYDAWDPSVAQAYGGVESVAPSPSAIPPPTTRSTSSAQAPASTATAPPLEALNNAPRAGGRGKIIIPLAMLVAISLVL